MYRILIVYFSCVTLCLCAETPPSAELEIHNVLWRWTLFLLSRSGVYLTLVALITFNFLAKAVKEKFGGVNTAPSGIAETEQVNQNWDKIRTKWPSDSRLDRHGGNISTDTDDTEYIKQRLREAEITMTALKTELEETQKTKTTLENSLEEIEKDRSSSEDELMRTKVAGALEKENLKKENSSLEKQLERARTDIEGMSKEIEVLQREARIYESALRDQQSLSERLETTRTELEAVKNQLKGIKIERDTAVRLASEQIHKKMASDGSVQRREVIEEMIDMELKRVREEEEAIDRTDMMFSQSEVFIDESQHEQEPSTSYAPGNAVIHRNAVGDAPACTCPEESYNLATETSTYSNLDRTVSTSDDCTDEDSERPHIVTGSPAFRAFLRSNFGAPA